jgi:hypothetical protein
MHFLSLLKSGHDVAIGAPILLAWQLREGQHRQKGRSLSRLSRRSE